MMSPFKYLVIVTSMFTAIGVYYYFVPAADRKAKSIVINKEAAANSVIFTVGKAISQKTSYVIKNVANVDARIYLKGASCNCVSTIIDGEIFRVGSNIPLPAGREVKLVISYDIPLEERLHSQSVLLSFDMGDGKPFDKTIDTDVMAYRQVATTPKSIEVDSTDVVSVERAIVILERANERKLSPAPEIVVNPSWLEVVSQPHLVQEKKIGDKIWEREWRATIRVHQSQALSQGNSVTARGTVEILSSVTGGSTFHHNANVFVRKTVGIACLSNLAFESATPGSTRKRRIVLRSVDGKEFRILSTKSKLPNLEIKPLATGASTEVWLEIVVNSVSEIPVSDIVKIVTTHPSTPEIALGVSINPRNASQ